MGPEFVWGVTIWWAVVLAIRDDPQAKLSCGTHAQVVEGDLRAGRFWFEAAYRAADQVGDELTMAHAALGLSGLWAHQNRTAASGAVLRARLERALSQVDPASTLGIRLRVRLAAEHDYPRGDSTTILSVVPEARRHDDAVALAEALSLAHQCSLGPGHAALRRALAQDLIAASVRTGRRVDLLMGLLWQVVDLLLEGSPHAERGLAELRGMLAEEDHAAIGFVVSAIEAMLAIRAGKLDQAEALSLACAQRGRAAGDVDATAWHTTQLVVIRWYQGRLTDLLPALRELVRSPRLNAVDSSHDAMLAWAAAMAGDRHTATGRLAMLRGSSMSHLPRSSTWLITMYAIVEAANLAGNRHAAARAYHLLAPYAHLPMVGGVGVACFGSVQHALGVAALGMGDAGAAVAHLREAVHHNQALGHWPAVMMSRLRYAEALSLRAQPSDAVAAHGQLAEAKEEASMLDLELPRLGTPVAPRSAAVMRQGHSWRVSLGGHSVVVVHSVGMLHLAVLTANPGTEIPSVDLVNGVTSLAAAADRGAPEQQILDRTAVQEYRKRLAQLREQIDDLEASAEPERAEHARAERDWLVAQLAGGTGLGGRARRFADTSERARIAAGRAIRRAIARIHEADQVLGDHLRNHVHTGNRCCYRPT